MMNHGGLKAIAIAMITVGCLTAVVLGAEPLIVLTIGFVGVSAIGVL